MRTRHGGEGIVRKLLQKLRESGRGRNRLSREDEFHSSTLTSKL